MARGRQVIRQWKLLRILERSRAGVRAEDLVDQIDEPCHVRTIYRDLTQLQEAGFPVVDEDGRWRIPLGERWGAVTVPVEASELVGLLVSEDVLDPLDATPFAEPLQRLRDKLTATLTPIGRKWVGELQRHVAVRLPGAARSPVDEEAFELLRHAIDHEEVVSVVYQKPGHEPAERLLEPYTWWWESGRLYFVAWCRTAARFRTFAVQRVRSVALVGEAFEPDPSFDPQQFIRRGFGVVHGAAHDVAVWFDASIAHLFDERAYHHTQRVERVADGVRVTMHAAGLAEIAAWIAGFGGMARAERPLELVTAVRRIHEEGLARLNTPTEVGKAASTPNSIGSPPASGEPMS